jgi:hypothetical protein
LLSKRKERKERRRRKTEWKGSIRGDLASSLTMTNPLMARVQVRRVVPRRSKPLDFLTLSLIDLPSFKVVNILLSIVS